MKPVLKRLCHAAEVARWRLSKAMGLPGLERVTWGCLFWAAVSGVAAGYSITGMLSARSAAAGEPVTAFWNVVISIALMLVSAYLSYAAQPKPETPSPGQPQKPEVEDGTSLREVFGTVWIDNPMQLLWRPGEPEAIRQRAGKTWKLRTKWQTVGYHYRYDLQFGLAYGIDSLLEFRGGDATAWQGRLITNGTVSIDKPELWGGADGGEGGIVGPMDVLFGEQDQEPHPYLVAEFDQRSALRGKATVLFRNAKWGAFSPYPKMPTFKVERFEGAWPNDAPWYPETVRVELGALRAASRDWRYLVVPNSDTINRAAIDLDDSSWAVGRPPFASAPWDLPGEYGFATEPATLVPASQRVWMRTRVSFLQIPPTMRFQAFVDNDCRLFVNGHLVTTVGGTHGAYYDVEIPTDAFVAGENFIAVEGWDRHDGPGNWFWFDWRLTGARVSGMNAAHILFYSKVSPTMEALPAAALDDTHWRDQAERLRFEGFGLACEWVPGSETVESFQQRILNIIGGALVKSRRDGKWRLFLDRDDNYDVAELPVLTDDDLLECREEPSVLDNAVNQLQTRWFDPELKEFRITPAEHAHSMIEAFGGVVSQTQDMPEIPEEGLAMIVNSRGLQERSTPVTRLTLVCKRRAADWDPFSRVRVQCPRHGVADMVALVLKSDVGETAASAVRLVVVEKLSAQPKTTYVGPQDPVDYSPSPIPLPAPAQRLFEAPYVDLVALLGAAEASALADDVGLVHFVAARPASGLNYVLATGVNGQPLEQDGTFDWCPNAAVVEAAGHADTRFSLAGGSRLEAVLTGTAALWDDEVVRVDAVDAAAGVLTLGRGCADTVPVSHVAGSRIWFFDEWSATDNREYSDGDVVTAKALTATGSERLEASSAPGSMVEMRSRALRPYPPGRFLINGQAAPASLHGEILVTWAHRDRLLQADELVDATAPSFGPEFGTTYTLRAYLDGNLVDTQSGVLGTSATTTPPGSGRVRIELESIRDGTVSWQAHEREFDYTPEPTNARVTTEGARRVVVTGNKRITTG